MIVDDKGQIQLSVEDGTGFLVYSYGGKPGYLINASPAAKYPKLVSGEGAKSLIGDKGWLPVAADVKDDRGVVVQKYTFANATSSRPMTTYRAYGFDLISGVITGIFDYKGDFVAAEKIIDSGETSPQDYMPGMRLVYGGNEAAIFGEIDSWLSKFDVVINSRSPVEPPAKRFVVAATDRRPSQNSAAVTAGADTAAAPMPQVSSGRSSSQAPVVSDSAKALLPTRPATTAPTSKSRTQSSSQSSVPQRASATSTRASRLLSKVSLRDAVPVKSTQRAVLTPLRKSAGTAVPKGFSPSTARGRSKT